MRDPFEELKHLTGDSSLPLPPAEVRRRGDRMRRRRHVLQTVAAAAAVAVVVSGGALASAQLTHTAPPPGPAKHHDVPKPSDPEPSEPAPSEEPAPEHGWVTTVPDDLGQALFDSLPAPVEGESTFTSAGLKVPWKALPCGDVDEKSTGPQLRNTWYPGLDDERTDQRFALIQPPEQTDARQLVVYEDGETAAAVIEAIRDQTEGCGPLESIPGITEFRWSARPFDFGGDEGMLLGGAEFVLDSDKRGIGRQLIGLTRQGNAVLTVVLSDESSAHPDDLTEPEAADLVELTTRFSGEMCIFAVDACAQENPENPESSDPAVPERPTYLLSAEDLTDATGVKGWQVTEEDWGPALVCSEDSTEALGGDRTTTLQYTVTRGGQTAAWATMTALDFASQDWANEAYATAADWLTTCDASIDRKHRIFSAGEEYGDMHPGGPQGRPWVWRTVMTSRPELCVECDAAWNNHQAVVSAGRRLMLVQVSYGGDMQSSVDESSSPFPDLAELAAKRAWTE